MKMYNHYNVIFKYSQYQSVSPSCFHLPLNPKQVLTGFWSLENCLFWILNIILHISGITCCMIPCDHILSCNIVFHPCCSMYQYFIPSYCWIISHYLLHHIFVGLLLGDGSLSCFYFLFLMLLRCYECLCVHKFSFLWDIYQGVELECISILISPHSHQHL